MKSPLSESFFTFLLFNFMKKADFFPRDVHRSISKQPVNWYCLWTLTCLKQLLYIMTMQAQLYWVLIIMDIVLSFVLNMKNQAHYSANVLYILFYIVLGKVVFPTTTACLPAGETVLFLKVFLYSLLKMEAFFLLYVVQHFNNHF